MNKGIRFPQTELTRLGDLALTAILSEIDDGAGLTSELAVKMGVLATLLRIAEGLSRLVGIKNMTRLVAEGAKKERLVNDQQFLFLFNAMLLNATGHPHRQRRLLRQAVKRGHISVAAATELRYIHQIGGLAHMPTLLADPNDQLDRQQLADLEPPGEFEQDPMNPCGATDPRF